MSTKKATFAINPAGISDIKAELKFSLDRAVVLDCSVLVHFVTYFVFFRQFIKAVSDYSSIIITGY